MPQASSAKVREAIVQVKGNEYRRWLVDFGTVNGKRKRRSCKTRKLAERVVKDWEQKQAVEAEKRKILCRKIGEKAELLATDELLDAAKGLEVLAGRSSLQHAAQFYVQHTEPAGGRRTVNELTGEYLQAKRQAGRRQDTIREIRIRLGKMSEDFGATYVHQVTTHDLEKWLDARGYQGQTRTNYKRVFTGFWSFALKRKLATYNPALGIEKPSIDEKIPAILTPKQVEQLLSGARDHVPEMLPHFALGIFAGIRPAELQKLDWSNIDLTARRIRIIPETAKKRRMRYVDISDNLLAWLVPYKRDSGPVHFNRREFDTVRRKAGVSWSPDIMRHSFGGYHLAQHENAALTSLQMGHQNTSVLFNHYRDLVKREDAAEFWSIRPKAESNVIQFVKAG